MERQLQFFRQHPSDLLTRPPLASSLQSFESSLYFLALDCYPHAFTSCVFAIENSLRAGLEIPVESRESLHKLLERACGILPRLAIFSRERVDEMRALRNRIVHYGFGPGDGKRSAGLLLEDAIPILAIVYEGFFKFDLYEALSMELGPQLRTAINVYSRIRFDPGTDGRRCCSVLAHAIRWGIRESLMTDWEVKAAEDADSDGLRFAMVDRHKYRLEGAFGASWAFECPICGDPSLVAELVKSQLDLGKITLARAACADCGLMIPDVPFLVDAICAEGIEEDRNEILRGYGISSA